MSAPNCHFCGQPLKGRADTTWEDGGLRADDCAQCGIYQVPMDLIPVVDALSPEARSEIAEYLAALSAQEDAVPMRFTPGFFGL